MAKITYEFAIKKHVLNSGKVIFTPVCRKKSFWSFFFSENWERITKIYGRYFLLDLDFDLNPDASPNLSYQDCEEHIQGFQIALQKATENVVKNVEYHTLEKKEFDN
jgi:hypothetical protein